MAGRRPAQNEGRWESDRRGSERKGPTARARRLMVQGVLVLIAGLGWRLVSHGLVKPPPRKYAGALVRWVCWSTQSSGLASREEGGRTGRASRRQKRRRRWASERAMRSLRVRGGCGGRSTFFNHFPRSRSPEPLRHLSHTSPPLSQLQTPATNMFNLLGPLTARRR